MTQEERDALERAIRACYADRSVRAPRLAALAEFIRATWPDLRVSLEPWRSSTDRKIPGTRLRRPGKGRDGKRLLVAQGAGLLREDRLLDHRSGETYRENRDVCRWIAERLDHEDAAPFSSRKSTSEISE